MADDLVSEYLGHGNGYGISHLPRHGVEVTAESEVHRECLNTSRLAHADRPILGRVPEAAVGKTNTARCQCGGWPIFDHPTVNVGMSRMSFVAFQFKFGGPVSPVPAYGGGCNATQVLG